MKPRDDELRIRPGRIRDKGRGAAKPRSFVGQVMRAARMAGRREVAVRALEEAVPQRWPCRSGRRRVG